MTSPMPSNSQTRSLLDILFATFESPWICGALGLLFYLRISLLGSSLGTPVFFMDYLADAFLHQQLYLRLPPPTTLDLSFFHERFYVYWGPLSAILVMPWVWLFGVGVPDRVFSSILGGLNIVFLGLLLRHIPPLFGNAPPLSREQRGMILVTFAFGTTHAAIAPLGNVWYFTQILSLTCVILGCLACCKNAPLLAGIAFACAALTRNHLAATALMGWALFPASEKWRKVTLVKILSPITAAFFLLLFYNFLRFDNPLENGITYHLMGEGFIEDFQKHGAFSISYIPKNMYFNFVFYPFPLRELSGHGGSLFLLTPLFFASFLAFRLSIVSLWPIWGSLVLCAIPVFLVMGTGFLTFGPRYTLDFTLPLIFLTALSLHRGPLWLWKGATIVGILHFVVGSTLLAEWYGAL